MPDQHQIIYRPSIGDDNPHLLKTQTFQVFALALQILQCVLFVYAMGLEKPVKLIPCSKA